MDLSWYKQHSKNALFFATVTLAIAFSLDAINLLGTRSSEGRQLHQIKEKGLIWTATTQGLPEGNYFLSAGRVKGECEATLDGNIIDSSRGEQGGGLQRLLLGASLKLEARSNHLIEIRCFEQPGFRGGLADDPVLLPYISGRLLEFLRWCLYIGLGPLISLILLVECINPFGDAPETHRMLRKSVRYSIFAFAAISLLYALSLGRVPRGLLSNYPATILHIILRSLISLSFLEIIAQFRRRLWPVTLGYIFVLIMDLVVASVYRDSPEVLVMVYKWHHPFYAISTFVTWFDLVRGRVYSKAVEWLQIVAGVWSITQAIDAYFNFFDSGTYKSPMVIILVTLGILILRQKELWTASRIEKAVQQILKTMTSNVELKKQLLEISKAVFNETTFERFSIYLDCYCLGGSDRPHRIFERVAESGYKKNTEADFTIVFDDDRGSIMAEALKSGEIIFRRGRDDCWFCVIPIGRLGCLNLSNDSLTDVITAHESYQIVSRLRSSLDTLADKLLTYTLKRNSSLERIVGIKGFGNFPVRLGAVFLDVIGFSKSIEKYEILSGGKDMYGPFVTGTYLPALIKAVGDYAQFEKSVGDMLYLVILPDLIPKTETVETATVKAISAICRFVAYEGARMCEDFKFEPIQLCIGAYTGDGTIISDEMLVKTTGSAVNYASRLYENAPTGSVLVPEHLYPLFSKEEFFVLEPKDILEKKESLVARTLYFKSSEKDA